jgi:hypothetical protein
MRAAKIGREMACFRAVACCPQRDAGGLPEMMLKSLKIDNFRKP